MFTCNNGVAVTLNPAWEYHEQYQKRPNYPRNVEPKYMVTMPRIEIYTNSLSVALRLVNDKRKIVGQRRRHAKWLKRQGIDIPF